MMRNLDNRRDLEHRFTESKNNQGNITSEEYKSGKRGVTRLVIAREYIAIVNLKCKQMLLGKKIGQQNVKSRQKDFKKDVQSK